MTCMIVSALFFLLFLEVLSGFISDVQMTSKSWFKASRVKIFADFNFVKL